MVRVKQIERRDYGNEQRADPDSRLGPGTEPARGDARVTGTDENEARKPSVRTVKPLKAGLGCERPQKNRVNGSHERQLEWERFLQFKMLKLLKISRDDILGIWRRLRFDRRCHWLPTGDVSRANQGGFFPSARAKPRPAGGLPAIQQIEAPRYSGQWLNARSGRDSGFGTDSQEAGGAESSPAIFVGSESCFACS